MKKSIFMHMCQSAYYLINHGSMFNYNILNLGLCEGLALLFHLSIYFVQVVIQILEYHVQFFSDQEYFFQFNYV